MSAPLPRLANDGSGFPAANDEPENPKVKLASRLGLLEVMPPARECIGREDSGLPRFGEVTVEDSMRERPIPAYGVWYTGDLGQPGGMEQAWQAAPNPAVFDAVTEGVHELARRLLIWTVDEHRVPVKVEHHDLSPWARHAHHLWERALGVVEVHKHPLGPAAVERGIGKREILGVSLDELDRQL